MDTCSFEYPANIISDTVFFPDDEKEGSSPMTKLVTVIKGKKTFFPEQISDRSICINGDIFDIIMAIEQ